MHKSRFVNLLRTLEKPELSAFRKYLKCLHANEQTALSLFAYILKFAPVYDDKVKLDLAYAFRKIYRRDIGDERKKMLNALSDLHAWLKAFLMSQKTAGSSFEDRALWLSVLQERRLEAELSRQVQILQHAESAEPVKGAIDYLKNTAVSHFVYYHHVHDNLDSDNRSLREYEKALDLFYAVAKLKIACEALSRQNVLTMQARSGEALPVPDIGDLKDAEQHPLLLLYREAYRLLADGEETAFERCKTLLTKHAAGLAPSETHRLITYLSNYASARLRNGDTAYWQKTHELNKLGVKHAAFLREDWMSVTQFNNIVSVACTIGDIAWAEHFVKTQAHFLKAPLRAEAALLARATILFEKKQYRKVLALLERQKFGATLDNIRARALLLKCCYELEHDDVLEKCIAFDVFLKKHSRHPAAKASRNFSDILKAIVRRRLSDDKIRADIHNTKHLYFREWLLKKLEV